MHELKIMKEYNPIKSINFETKQCRQARTKRASKFFLGDAVII